MFFTTTIKAVSSRGRQGSKEKQTHLVFAVALQLQVQNINALRLTSLAISRDYHRRESSRIVIHFWFSISIFVVSPADS